MDSIDCPRCEHEHEPSGSHEDDSGKWECEECGFMFKCEIEYDPTYLTWCVNHEYGEVITSDIDGEPYRVQRCKHCQRCRIETTTATGGDATGAF